MRSSVVVLLGMTSLGLSNAIEVVASSTTTITITMTSTSTIHIPTAPGWLPADLTKNHVPHARKVGGKAASRSNLAKDIVIPKPHVVKATAACNGVATVTVTQTAAATATVTSYDACQDHRNFIENVSAGGESGVDGVCGCEIYTTANSVPSVDAQDCCHLCWADHDCIGSLWSQNPTFGPTCTWITATTCGATQGYNYSKFIVFYLLTFCKIQITN